MPDDLPLPLDVPLRAEGTQVRCASGDLVASIDCCVEAEADRQTAAYIARAVNAHQPMLDALRLLLAAPALHLEGGEPEDLAAIETAEAAIALAEGR